MIALKRAVMYLWFALIVRPIVRLVVGVSVFGRERLTLDEPTIIVANHNSHLDAAVLMDVIGLRRLAKVRAVAAADYFERGPIRRFIFETCMNVLPIRRDRVTRRHNPMTPMLEQLDRGGSLILFPEGTRGEPEKLAEFKTGIAHLIESRPHVRVLAVYMRNLGLCLPRGEFVLVPMFCDVHIGEPRRLTGPREIMRQLAECFADLQRQAEQIRPSAAPVGDR
jgi:1-acyl-sn-glycerol-3-phosphate acyltransferase